MERLNNIDEISLAKMLQQSVCRTDSGLLPPAQEAAATPPVTELNQVKQDLEVQEKTVKARTAERRELDDKLAELVELIQQARKEVAQEVESMRRPKL